MSGSFSGCPQDQAYCSTRHCVSQHDALHSHRYTGFLCISRQPFRIVYSQDSYVSGGRQSVRQSNCIAAFVPSISFKINTVSVIWVIPISYRLRYPSLTLWSLNTYCLVALDYRNCRPNVLPMFKLRSSQNPQSNQILGHEIKFHDTSHPMVPFIDRYKKCWGTDHGPLQCRNSNSQALSDTRRNKSK